MAEYIPEDLFVGEPVLTARWRLHHRALPLKNRHLRAFTKSGVSNGLASWARQHIEWTLAEGTGEYPDGVLALAVDAEGRAVMAAEPYEPLPALTAAELLEHVGGMEGQPVEGEVAWVARDGGLIALTDAEKPLSGANSLVVDLAETLRMPLSYQARAAYEPAAGDEVFLVSDEHGVVAAKDGAGSVAARFAAYYEKLVGMAKPDKHDCANLGILG